MKRTQATVWILLLGFVTFSCVLYFLFSLRRATPIADDYCFAQLSKRGAILGTYDQFMTWDGNYTLTFLTVMFVGAPLIAFGPQIGSAFPMLLMTLVLLILFFTISKFLIRNSDRKYLYAFVSALTIFGSWNVFWMSFKKSPALIGSNFNSNFAMLSDGFVHWKTLQVSYLLMFFVVFFVSFLSWRQICSQQFMPTLIPLGIILGGSSYILAGTSFLIIQYTLLRQGWSFLKSHLKNNLFFSIPLTIGLLLNYFSPGAQRRKDVLDSALSSTRSVSVSLIQTLEYLLNSFFSIGFIVMIICGFSLAPLYSKHYLAFNIIRHSPIVYLFLSILTTIGCYFAGSSPWRYSHIYVVTWIFGLLVGVHLYQRQSQLLWMVKFAAIATCLIFSVIFYEGVSGVEIRYNAFIQGPSPISGIEDIESSWVRDCAIASNLNRS